MTMGLKSTYQELRYTQGPSFYKRNEYNIQKIIGRGSSGKVVQAKWKNKDQGIKKDVALKSVLHARQKGLPRRIIDKEIIRSAPNMVMAEIEILKVLNHENIVQFYDVFESKHKYVLIS